MPDDSGPRSGPTAEDQRRAGHNSAVRTQFRRQAATYSTTGFATRGLDWIVEGLDPAGTEQVLDVAAGAGHLSRALAPRVAHVSALDLTPEMLEQGRQLTESAGVGNVAFLRGDASALPWIDGQFDLTVCRLTLHQVADPAAVVREMVRVTRRAGRIAIVDMTADDDPVTAAETNRLERLRDPSHGRTLTRSEIESLLHDAGARVRSTSQQCQVLDVEDWMQRTDTPAQVRADIRDRLAEELAGGTPTGLLPAHDADGRLVLTHPWTMTTAVPAPGPGSAG